MSYDIASRLPLLKAWLRKCRGSRWNFLAMRSRTRDMHGVNCTHPRAETRREIDRQKETETQTGRRTTIDTISETAVSHSVRASDEHHTSIAYSGIETSSVKKNMTTTTQLRSASVRCSLYTLIDSLDVHTQSTRVRSSSLTSSLRYLFSTWHEHFS